MTDYAVTGKKRSGKGLFCVGLIRDALREGRRVATNMDIYIDKMVGPSSRATIWRLPDSPRVSDFEALGLGNDVVDDTKNGIIVLDETSAIFNARAWNDKDRQPVLDWLIHSGKLGWDVYYQMQGLSQIDKQIRDTQVEFHVPVRNTAKWPIPVVSSLGRMVGLDIRFPKMHIGVFKQGIDRDALIVERKWFRAKDLYKAYDTRQVFLPRDHPQACGLHTVLSAYHIKGRYLGWWAMNKNILYGGMLMGAVIGSAMGGYLGYEAGKPSETVVQQTQVDTSVKVAGLIQELHQISVMLSDGRILPATQIKRDGDVDYYLVNGKWVGR